jgi:hypothetical protein
MLAVVAATAAAASGSPGFDPLTTWAIGQGTLGIIIIGLVYALRKESARADTERTNGAAAVAAERARADAAVAAKDVMVDTFLNRIVPALTESTSATRELAEARRMHGHGQ